MAWWHTRYPGKGLAVGGLTPVLPLLAWPHAASQTSIKLSWMTETQQAAVIHNICVDMLLLYNFKSHVLNMTYVNFILPTGLLITGIACQTGLSRLMIQVYLKEDLINIGSISILYMTFEHRLKEPEVAVILAISRNSPRWGLFIFAIKNYKHAVHY